MTLTPRQTQVLTQLANGKRYSGVGRELGLSAWVCKDHALNAVQSLGARNVTHAVAIAIRKQLIQPPQ